MADRTRPTPAPAPSRRAFLARGGRALGLAAGAGLAPLALSGCKAGGGDTVKVGILHSQTGTTAFSEMPLRDAELAAVEEINAAGGVLGRQVEPVVEDVKSRTDLHPRRAEKLLAEDKVAAVFGCWTSAGRKAVLPVVEGYNGLLFYPVYYEGNESSPNVVYAGSVPNQQIFPAVDWLLSPAGGGRRRFYLVGSDFVFPRTVNFVLKKYLPAKGAEVVGEAYPRPGLRDYKEVVRQVAGADPHAVISTINSDSNATFYKELAAQGVTAAKVPVVATGVGEDELRGLPPEWVEGHLAAWSYFQTVPTPANQTFVRRFKEEHGSDRVTCDTIETAYTAVHLWKLAAEKAGGFEADKVREALRGGVEFDAPGGRVRVDPKTQHTSRRFRLGRIRGDRQFAVVHESPDWIEPDPYPQVAFPGWRCDWTRGGLTRGSPVDVGG